MEERWSMDVSMTYSLVKCAARSPLSAQVRTKPGIPQWTIQYSIVDEDSSWFERIFQQCVPQLGISLI